MSQSKSKVNLRICGSESTIVDLDQVQAVNTPQVEYRKERNRDGSLSVSYQPISHNLLIDKTRKHLTNGGFEVVDECHNLARQGKRYFGLFEVTHPTRENTERGTIIGLRNAHDKCFPAGLCAGDAPFVCDNLIFTNSVKLARRHTKHILSELDQVIARTLGKLFTFWGGQDQRIDSYKAFELNNPQVNDLVIRAYKAGAISKTKVVDVVNQWEKSDHPAFWDRNMNSLYNAFTEVYKGNLVALPQRSDALHSVLDSEVGFDLSAFEATEEAELVESVAVEPASELAIVGQIDGEVPASVYEDDSF
jgi:hypothetical protein|tara:strand:+ start:328 stop:1245 length:918 start_codon:yes stop_codon:yes gene_type:complete